MRKVLMKSPNHPENQMLKDYCSVTHRSGFISQNANMLEMSTWWCCRNHVLVCEAYDHGANV